MGEQASEVVNPSQAIYDALTDEAKAEVDALPEDVFTGEVGTISATYLGREIVAANALNDAIWSIQCDGRTSGREFIVVNVGSVNTASWSGNSLRLIVDPKRLDVESLSRFPGVSRTDRAYDSLPHVEIRIDSDVLLRGIPEEVLRAHEAALAQHPEQSWKRNMRANWHRDDWRVKIAILSGVGLPAPAYIPESKRGQRMDVSMDLSNDAGGDGRSKRYWKISAGRGAEEWPRFRDDSIIAMSWYEEHFDPSDLPDDREQFIEVLMDTIPDLSHAGARSLWAFRNEVTEGDHVLVYSNYQVLAHGIVTGPYYFATEPSGYHHRREVDWQASTPVSTRHVPADLQRKLSLQQTLVELTLDEFAMVIQRDMMRDEPLNVGATLAHGFASAGLTYTDEQVASFYTALQTKGFVILSGISGTGKSKIAQRFADMLPDTPTGGTVFSIAGMDGIRLRLRPYMQKYNRFAIPMKVQEQLPVPEPGGTWEVPIEIDGRAGPCRIHTADGTNNSNTWIYLKGEAVDDFSRIDEDFFLVDFVPDAEHGVSKVVVRSGARPETDAPAYGDRCSNHLFLPVRSDWRDGKALIGYHNPLSGEYVRTDFLDFVLAASDDYSTGNRNAFFVILDEMNLAHVEYYFADVLSVIESGRHPDDHELAGWTVEGIPLTVGEEDADLPEALRLPPNLYIIGTVNMDETTHPFSPKVLDRAFTIELTDVSFEGYPPEVGEGADLEDEERQALLAAFTREGGIPVSIRPRSARWWRPTRVTAPTCRASTPA